MPGYVIHLAVGKIYSQNNKIENLSDFEKGIIAPDMIEDKSKSHYGDFSSCPKLNRFINEHGISSSYDEGYFLHLLTDYLFYNKFLDRWDNVIYDDYNKLNYRLIQKYGIIVPDEVSETVNFIDGIPTLLDEEKLCTFIESVGKINVRQIVSQKDINCEDFIEELET